MVPPRIDQQASRGSLELLYNVSRELASALDLPTLLQRILSLSMEHVGAIRGSIIVVNEAGFAVDSALITGGKIYQGVTNQLRITLEQGLAGWVARQKKAVLIPDTSRDQRWLRRPDDSEDQTGPKSALVVPLLARDQLVGVLTLVHPTPGFFENEHSELIQAIAAHAGTAVLNARLYAESQRQARVMTAIAESAMAITASLRLEEVLQRILRQTKKALRVKTVSLALFSPTEQVLKYCASTSKPDQDIQGKRLWLDPSVNDLITQEGRGVILPKASIRRTSTEGIEQSLRTDTSAVAYAPIHSQNKLIGVLEAISPQGGEFSPDTLLFLTGIGSLAGTAIHHAQLYERLQSTSQRYHDLFEDSIDPIIITNTDGTILEVNRRAELVGGYKGGALISKNIADINIIDPKKAGIQLQKLVSGDTISYEAFLQGEGDRQIPVQVHARAFNSERSLSLQWILHDLSEQFRLERLREDLIAMVYHDLRSPLTNVISTLDVLDASSLLDSDPELKTMLSISMRSTRRIQRLTSSLLDIHRIEAGHSLIDRGRVSPLSISGEAIETVRPAVEHRNQILEVAIHEDLPDIYVDPDMVSRVLINLLENAVKFTPHGGKMAFGAQEDGEWVRFWIQDSGPGIPVEEKQRIFDKYTRLHPVEGPKGIGLGLAFCKLAIDAHGGRIWVESKEGKGACFFLTLPIATQEGEV